MRCCRGWTIVLGVEDTPVLKAHSSHILSLQGSFPNIVPEDWHVTSRLTLPWRLLPIFHTLNLSKRQVQLEIGDVDIDLKAHPTLLQVRLQPPCCAFPRQHQDHQRCDSLRFSVEAQTQETIYSHTCRWINLVCTHRIHCPGKWKAVYVTESNWMILGGRHVQNQNQVLVQNTSDEALHIMPGQVLGYMEVQHMCNVGYAHRAWHMFLSVWLLCVVHGTKKKA